MPDKSDPKATGDPKEAPDTKPAKDGKGSKPPVAVGPIKKAERIVQIVTQARAEAAQAKQSPAPPPPPPVPTVTVKPVAGSAEAAAAQAELSQAVARAMAPATTPTPEPEPKAESKPNPEPAPKPEPQPQPQPQSKLTITARKRGPGRPKAGRLDVPVAAVATTTATASAPSAPIDTPPAPSPTTTTRTLTPPVKPTPPAAPRLRPSGSAPHQPVVDIKPPASKLSAAHPTPAASSTNTAPASPSPIVTVPDEALRSDQPLILEDPPLGMGVLTRASLHERVRPASLGWSLLPATFLALIAGGVTLALLRGHIATVWAATQQAAWAVSGELVCVVALYYLSHSLVSGALMYGAARRAAHRPVPLSRQFSVSLNTWLPRLMLDLLSLFALAGVAGLGAALVFTGGISWPVPAYLQLAGLFIAFLALVYLVAGLLLTQGLGRAGLTVATISPWAAMVLSWQLFQRHFELTGFRILALLLELALLVPFAGAAALLIMYVPASFSWATAGIIVILATLAGGLIGAGTAAWWEAAYRHLVERDLPDQTAKLLTARIAERPRRLSLVLTIIVATTLISGAIVWPWLQ